MDGQHETELKNLLAISKFDALLAGISAQKKELEAQYKEKKQLLDTTSYNHGKKLSEFENRRDTYQKEEKRLKEQQQKLVDRRKALTTLGSYKLQMVAEQEIDASSRQLSAQEEALLKNLDSLEVLEKEAATAPEAYEKAKADFDAFAKECKETLANMKVRVAQYNGEKNKLTPLIEPRTLDTYKRIAQRHIDPVVPLKNNSCGGCHLELGPQMAVDLACASSLIRCRSCGRFLYLDDSEEGEEVKE